MSEVVTLVVVSWVAETGVGRRGGVEVKVEGCDGCEVCDGCEGCDGCGCLRREGGIMMGVNSLGGSFPRTFSATRYMASANCSAFSFPFFWTSHRLLGGRGGGVSMVSEMEYYNIVTNV